MHISGSQLVYVIATKFQRLHPCFWGQATRIDHRLLGILSYVWVSINFSHAIQFGSTPPLLDLSTSQFHSKLKTNLFHKFLLSLFHTLTSFLWLSSPGFRFSISLSFSLYIIHNMHIHLLYGHCTEYSV